MQRSLFPPDGFGTDKSDLEVRLPRVSRPRVSRDSGSGPLRLAVLGSGSAGNATVVESGGRRILIDAGFSCRQLEKRLEILGLASDDLDAVILTHEHGDHCRGVDRFCRRHRTALYATEGTLESLKIADTTRREATVLSSGQRREIAGFEVEPFAVPHDAREPVGFVIEDAGGRRVGLASDLGCRSQLAWAALSDLDGLVLESNHDLEMLRTGPYPWVLKQRVASRHGHLSNHDAAQGIPELVGDRLSWVVLYHLSRTNNLPALAVSAVGEALAKEGSRAAVAVADQDEPSGWLEVE